MNDHDRTAHRANALVPVEIDSTSLERLDPPTPVPADADDRPPLLRDLAARIAQVMKAVRSLAHDACNTHSDYNYASADKFYQALQQPLAEAELVVRCDEVDCRLFTVPNRDGRPMLHARFVYELGFVGYPGAERRSLVLQVIGPQSFQAAETYARKYWLRGKFLVATGETDDVDAEPRYGADNPAPVPDRPPSPDPRSTADAADTPALPAATPSTNGVPDLAADLPDDFASELDRQRHLYRAFGTAMQATDDPGAVVDGNRGLWGDIPETGRVQLLKHFDLDPEDAA